MQLSERVWRRQRNFAGPSWCAICYNLIPANRPLCKEELIRLCGLLPELLQVAALHTKLSMLPQKSELSKHWGTLCWIPIMKDSSTLGSKPETLFSSNPDQ